MTGDGDRLGYALFMAAALHALLILGVAFDAPDPQAPSEVPTLEVTLLESPSDDETPPDDADYLAQANQRGAGNTEEDVPPEFADAPPAPDPEEVMRRGLTLQFASLAPAPPTEDAVLAPRSTVTVPARDPREAGETADQAPPPGGLLRVTGDGRREYFIAVNTRESEFAEYLAGWKARMERLGTLNFPTAAQRDDVRGQPVLEVALAADGRLEEVRIVRTSGDPELDRAALDLVRLGSPFDPFPPEVRASYDVLRFAYEWRFIGGRVAGSGIYAPGRP